jgi:alpha,alpha-trehalose phosphorylase
VAGFGGFRARKGTLTFAPRLPSAMTRLVFHLWYRNRCLRVSATSGEATYALITGEPLELTHHGEPLVVTSDPVSRPIPPPTPRPAPTQPPGRAPASRHPTGDE